VLPKNNAPISNKITVGELRKNPAMAALLRYKDNPASHDSDVIMLQGMFEESTAPAAWFPRLKWYPRAEKIRRKYEQRRAKLGQPKEAAAEQPQPSEKKKS
jgi:hypothetical protein